MTSNNDDKTKRAARAPTPLTWRGVVAFVLALFVVGGLMFVAGRMAGHAPPAGPSIGK